MLSFWSFRRANLVALLLGIAPLGWSQGTYTSTFPLTENPISEGGHWINGATVGLDWQNVQTSSGRAYGTQTGSSGQFDDSVAVLTGTWGPDQTVEGMAFTRNDGIGVGNEEVEIRLRTSVSPHVCTGYEINFSTAKGSSTASYIQIVRWNGALGDFTYLNAIGGILYGVSNGDVLKATITGTSPAIITAYLNGRPVLQATDPNPFTSGSPGIGFWNSSGLQSVNSDYGFRNFFATDQPVVPSK